MYIALVSPRSYAESFPLGLASLATNAGLESGDEIEIVDANVLDLSESEVVQYLAPKSPKLVGMSFMTYQAEYCYELTRLIKERFPDALVVHGGIHASWLPGDALDHGADVVVVGEGEHTFAELVACVRAGRPWDDIRGICLRSNGEVRRNEPRPFIADLDTLNPPDWSMFDIEKYNETIHVVEGQALPIMASRGCAFNCSFCSSLWKRRVRYRKLDAVIAELKRNIERTGIRKYHFYDDDFLIRPRFAREMCQRLIDEKLNIQWCADSRVGDINRNADLLPLLARSGCLGLEIGVESLDDVVLEKINKRQTANDSLVAVRLLKQHGIVPLWLTMTCNTGETIGGHYRQNRALTKMTGRYGVSWGQYATPFPGSKFYDDAPHTGIVFAERWNDYITRNVNYVPNSLLEEVPVRNRPRLTTLDVLLCKFAYREARPRPFGVDFERLYQLVDGGASVRRILDRYAADSAEDDKLAFQEGVKGVIIFAQLGLIRAQGEAGATQPYGLRWLVGFVVTQFKRAGRRLARMLGLEAVFH